MWCNHYGLREDEAIFLCDESTNRLFCMEHCSYWSNQTPDWVEEQGTGATTEHDPDMCGHQYKGNNIGKERDNA